MPTKADEWRKFTEARVHERRHVDVEVTIPELISALSHAAEGLEQARGEIEKDYGYDDYCSASFYVYGWRPKTQEELDAFQRQLELNEENARKSKEQAKKAEWTQAQNLFKKYRKELLKLDEGTNG